jgi:hypothetical protein
LDSKRSSHDQGPFTSLFLSCNQARQYYTKLKVALSTNSPPGTPATASTDMYILADPGFGNALAVYASKEEEFNKP